jgi:hypothetical protein
VGVRDERCPAYLGNSGRQPGTYKDIDPRASFEDAMKPKKIDTIEDALELVIDLASQNVIDKFDNPSEYRRQSAALKLVQETFSKSGDRL